MNSLDEVIQIAKVGARQIVESDEQHEPILFAISEDDISIIQLEGNFRPRFKEVLGSILKQFHADSYVFVNEAWTATLPKDSPWTKKLLSGEITVSDLPLDDRQEVVMIIAVENSISVRMYQAVIRETVDERRQLGDWNLLDNPDSFSGRMSLTSWESGE